MEGLLEVTTDSWLHQALVLPSTKCFENHYRTKQEWSDFLFQHTMTNSFVVDYTQGELSSPNIQLLLREGAVYWMG